MGLEYADRIRLSLVGGERVRAVVTKFRESIAAEVLAIDVSADNPVVGGYDRHVDVDGELVRVGIVLAEKT
jgi:Domain of unknown function (DUF5915)